MNKVLENILFIIIIILGVWLFFSMCFYTGTLAYKNECSDLKNSGMETVSNIRIGLFFVPYNSCIVKVEGIFYSLNDYSNDEIIYSKRYVNESKYKNIGNTKIKDSVIINGVELK